jgi:hypothetical protein
VPSLTKRVEHLPDRFWVAAHDHGGGLDVAGGIKVLPGEREPVLRASCAKKAPLRPPVALRTGYGWPSRGARRPLSCMSAPSRSQADNVWQYRLHGGESMHPQIRP